MKDTDLDDLAAKVRGLSPPDRLILAAELMRAGRSRLALAIAGAVVDGLRLADVLCEPNAKRDETPALDRIRNLRHGGPA